MTRTEIALRAAFEGLETGHPSPTRIEISFWNDFGNNVTESRATIYCVSIEEDFCLCGTRIERFSIEELDEFETKLTS